MGGEEKDYDEAREDLKNLKVKILRIEDRDKRREALEHLKRMKELLEIEGEY
jgi:5-bromo-4-chloroindolyl phosphate hydrolysis protein